MKILIVYDSNTGNTEKMARAVSEGVESEVVEVVVNRVGEVTIDELRDVHGLILGSPVYYGLLSAKMKRCIDETVEIHGKLENKVGGARASQDYLGCSEPGSDDPRDGRAGGGGVESPRLCIDGGPG